METMTTRATEILPLVPPDALGDTSDLHVVRFEAAVELLNRLQQDLWKHDDHATSAAERLVAWRTDDYRVQQRIVAVRHGRVVAVGALVMPTRDNTSLAYLRVDVAPEVRSAGLATAMLERLESAATVAGRRILVGATELRDSDEEHQVVRPRTGAGAVPAHDAGVRFALARGYSLDLVERMSMAALPADPERLRTLLQQARAAAGADYELVAWDGPCPGDLLEDYARLKRAISTDQPLGSLDMTPEHWDPERVRSAETDLTARNARSQTTAVRHVATGRLVAHSVLELIDDKPEAVWQGDTLVLSEHRGHRLGMVMKAANMTRVARLQPRARRLYTWNASENLHMLKINELLGFRPEGVTGIWQKKPDRV